MIERDKEHAIQFVRFSIETRWLWVQALHSTMTSSELSNIYEVYNKEVRKLGFEPKTFVGSTTYH